MVCPDPDIIITRLKIQVGLEIAPVQIIFYKDMSSDTVLIFAGGIYIEDIAGFECRFTDASTIRFGLPVVVKLYEFSGGHMLDIDMNPLTWRFLFRILQNGVATC